MRALYGSRTPKFVFLLRNPVDRIYSAFFGTKSFIERYGNTTKGFTQFVSEQVRATSFEPLCVQSYVILYCFMYAAQLSAYRRCVKNHTELDCILRFETLGIEEEKVFFHCDQVSIMAEFQLYEWIICKKTLLHSFSMFKTSRRAHSLSF